MSEGSEMRIRWCCNGLSKQSGTNVASEKIILVKALVENTSLLESSILFTTRIVISSESLRCPNVNVQVRLKARDGEWEGCH